MSNSNYGVFGRMPKRKKETEVLSDLENEEDLNETINKEVVERKGDYDEITRELKSTFSLPKYGLKDRTMTLMTRVDEKTLRIIDALVALDLAPSRSSAAAFLISEAIRKDEKYIKILESYETIKQAKKKAQYSFYKSLQDETDEEIEEDNIDN